MEETPPSGTPASALDDQQVTRLVAPPAIAMIVLTCLSLLFHIVELIFEPVGNLLAELFREVDVHMHGGGWYAFDIARNLFGFAISGVVLLGAFMMLQRRSWPLSLAAAILISVPCVGPCCPFGIPIGIWALVVLLRPEVREALERNG